MRQLETEFRAYQSLPNYCGVIDVTHIQIELPPDSASPAFFDHIKKYIIKLQTVVDIRMFTDVYTGWPDNVNDAAF